MKISLAGKRVLVTGAARGLGRGISEAVHACGGHVIAVARTQTDLDKLASDLPGITTIACDVADWKAARAMAESAGDVHCLVNNAGMAMKGQIIDTKPEDFDAIYALNVKSALNLSQVVAKNMIARGQGGSIVNMSSIAGIRPIVELGTYCTSKAALDHLTRVLAFELGQYNIRVNSVNPTVVMTDMARAVWEEDGSKYMIKRTPMGKFAEVEDIAMATVFLLSDAAAMICGTLVPVDGGYCSA